jgi:hypothetical protein
VHLEQARVDYSDLVGAAGDGQAVEVDAGDVACGGLWNKLDLEFGVTERFDLKNKIRISEKLKSTLFQDLGLKF